MDTPRRGVALSARWLNKLVDAVKSGRIQVSGRLRGVAGSTGVSLGFAADPSTWAKIDSHRGGGTYNVVLLNAVGSQPFQTVRTAIAKEVNGVTGIPANVIVWCQYAPFADDFRFQCAPCP